MVDHSSAVFDSHLLLDPAIRNWVVLPMLLLLLLVGIGRHYVQVLIKTETKSINKNLLMTSGQPVTHFHAYIIFNFGMYDVCYNADDIGPLGLILNPSRPKGKRTN